MNISLAELSQFTLYFKGNETVHGKFIPPLQEVGEGGKVNGKSFTVKEPLTSSKYRAHLEGREGIGVVPIDKNNNVRFSVIDVDDYRVAFTEYQEVINEFELPFLLFKSKSGGLHIYVFFTEDVKATKVVPLMQAWVTLLGLPEKTEIFPKQKRLRNESKGSWINLPYFGGNRKMLNERCEEVGLQEALSIIAQKACNFERLHTIYMDMPISDGPPCLQSIYVKNDPLLAELYLYNLAVYLKAKRPNDWQEFVHKANDRMSEPISESRVDGQVIASHEKSSYSYKCREEPICSRCNRAICETRALGVGGDEISELSFEGLTQVMSDPPHYKWIVNGSEMVFYSEAELRNQEKFADYCMRYLHKVPNRLKNMRWNTILNKAFLEIEQVKMDVRDDMSPGAILSDYFYEFVCERAMAKNRQQLYNMGRVWFDPKKEVYYFKKSDLTHFIVSIKNFRYFGITEIQDRVSKMGAGPCRLYIDKRINAMRCWSISKDCVVNLSEGTGGVDSTELDFTKYKEQDF